MKWQDVTPVLISILVIILVAVLQRQSKLFAAITATMPLNIVLAMWIVYAATDGDQEQMKQFNLSLLMGGLPTVGFLVAAWLGARAGLKLLPLLLLGYSTWGIGLLLITTLRRVWGG